MEPDHRVVDRKRVVAVADVVVANSKIQARWRVAEVSAEVEAGDAAVEGANHGRK